MLERMFALQAEFNARVGCPVSSEGLSEEDLAVWTLRLVRAMQGELTELTDCTSWKWWKPPTPLDRQNALVEIVDLWHFLLSLAMLHGLDAQALMSVYEQKLARNHERQDTGRQSMDDCRDIAPDWRIDVVDVSTPGDENYVVHVSKPGQAPLVALASTLEALLHKPFEEMTPGEIVATLTKECV